MKQRLNDLEKIGHEIARQAVIGLMPSLLREMRRLDLRAQARRKRRSGWRHEYIMPNWCIRRAERKASRA